MTLEEVADSISVGIPKWQRDRNLEFLRDLHPLLHDGGTWVAPKLGRIYRKTEEGFDLVGELGSRIG